MPIQTLVDTAPSCDFVNFDDSKLEEKGVQIGKETFEPGLRALRFELGYLNLGWRAGRGMLLAEAAVTQVRLFSFVVTFVCLFVTHPFPSNVNVSPKICNILSRPITYSCHGQSFDLPNLSIESETPYCHGATSS